MALLTKLRIAAVNAVRTGVSQLKSYFEKHLRAVSASDILNLKKICKEDGFPVECAMNDKFGFTEGKVHLVNMFYMLRNKRQQENVRTYANDIAEYLGNRRKT